MRSAAGYDNPWFQRALRSGEGRMRADGLERDVAFEVPELEMSEGICAACHAECDRYRPSINVADCTTTDSSGAVRVTRDQRMRQASLSHPDPLATFQPPGFAPQW